MKKKKKKMQQNINLNAQGSQLKNKRKYINIYDTAILKAYIFQ